MAKGSQVQVLSARPREPALTSGNAGSEPVRHLTPAELSLLLWSLADCASRGDGRAWRGTWRAAAPVRDMTKTARLFCGEAGGGGLSDGGERQAGPKGVPPSGQSGGSRRPGSMHPSVPRRMSTRSRAPVGAVRFPTRGPSAHAVRRCVLGRTVKRAAPGPRGGWRAGVARLCPSCTGRSWGSAGRAEQELLLWLSGGVVLRVTPVASEAPCARPRPEGGGTGARLVGCADRSERHSAGLPPPRWGTQSWANLCPVSKPWATCVPRLRAVVAPRRTSHGGPVALPRRMRARTSRCGLRCVTWTRLVLDYPPMARQDGGPRGRAAARAASATSVRAKSACWRSLRRRPPTCGLCTTTPDAGSPGPGRR